MDTDIVTIALNSLTKEFDKFVSECVDEHGNPRLPSKKAIMYARGCLPRTCINTLVVNKRK